MTTEGKFCVALAVVSLPIPRRGTKDAEAEDGNSFYPMWENNFLTGQQASKPLLRKGGGCTIRFFTVRPVPKVC